LIEEADRILPAVTETDMILNQLPGGAFGHDIAEKYGVPMSLVATIPLVRTSAFPMIGFPYRRALGPRYNLWSYQISEQLGWYMIRPIINKWRREVMGLPKASNRTYLDSIRTKKIPIVNGFSSLIVPRPQDWSDHVHVTGYWFAHDTDWEPTEALQRFIEQGPQPIYIGFGSMPLRDPHKATMMIFDALKVTGQRAVIHTGWGGLSQDDLPEYVYNIDYAPHSWLFQRMKAVVHHGGGGTTAAGLRAGVPSIIIPFVFDQFYWGKRISELGVGPEPIPIRKLTSDRLANAIKWAVSDDEMDASAASLGERIRAEDGVKNAVQVIEEIKRNS
jgi:UDP:flavonoid glycosyltransferase YjiC (YdhE family)